MKLFFCLKCVAHYYNIALNYIENFDMPIVKRLRVSLHIQDFMFVQYIHSKLSILHENTCDNIKKTTYIFLARFKVYWEKKINGQRRDEHIRPTTYLTYICT